MDWSVMAGPSRSRWQVVEHLGGGLGAASGVGPKQVRGSVAIINMAQRIATFIRLVCAARCRGGAWFRSATWLRGSRGPDGRPAEATSPLWAPGQGPVVERPAPLTHQALLDNYAPRCEGRCSASSRRPSCRDSRGRGSLCRSGCCESPWLADRLHRDRGRCRRAGGGCRASRRQGVAGGQAPTASTRAAT